MPRAPEWDLTPPPKGCQPRAGARPRPASLGSDHPLHTATQMSGVSWSGAVWGPAEAPITARGLHGQPASQLPLRSNPDFLQRVALGAGGSGRPQEQGRWGPASEDAPEGPGGWRPEVLSRESPGAHAPASAWGCAPPSQRAGTRGHRGSAARDASGQAGTGAGGQRLWGPYLELQGGPRVQPAPHQPQSCPWAAHGRAGQARPGGSSPSIRLASNSEAPSHVG